MSRRRDHAVESVLDRIEDRLVDAPYGLHEVGEPADEAALRQAAEAGLSAEALALWRRWDGLDLANGETRILSLGEQAEATAAADDEGILRPGDRVVGELGATRLVVPADPWAEGGEVVMVEDDGQRAPYASSVVKLALGLVAEMSLLYDDEGEYREGLFDEDGALDARAERKLLRRRLDFDEDAPFPRFRLAQLLRRGGELRGAKAELRRVLHCAPEFDWAHWELGRTLLALAEAGGDRERDAGASMQAEAAQCFAAAATRCDDPHLRALFLAWQALSLEGEAREVIAAEVRGLDPGFVAAREAGLREAIEDEDGPRARELLRLGLAIEPRHLGLLALRAAVEALPIERVEVRADSPAEDDVEADDEAGVEAGDDDEAEAGSADGDAPSEGDRPRGGRRDQPRATGKPGGKSRGRGRGPKPRGKPAKDRRR